MLGIYKHVAKEWPGVARPPHYMVKIHLINQDIPCDSEDGLNSVGDSINNGDDFDTFCNTVLDENDNNALFDLLNERFWSI